MRAESEGRGSAGEIGARREGGSRHSAGRCRRPRPLPRHAQVEPNDNQGIRYVLAGCLLRQDNDSALKELLAAHEDGSAFWLHTRALVAFRESSDEHEARGEL